MPIHTPRERRRRRRGKGIAQRVFRRGKLASPAARFIFFRRTPVGRFLRPFAKMLGI